MKPPSADPTPQYTRANLKELSATDRNTQNENFKLKLQLFHLRRQLKKARANDDRRESYATPKIDNFYEEENEDDNSEDGRRKLDDLEFESDNQVIRALQDKLEEKDSAISELEEENKSLWDAQNDLNTNLKNQSLIAEKLKTAHSSLQAKAEGSRLQMDAAVAAMEEAQNEAQEARKRLAEASIKIKHEQACAGTMQQTLEKEKMLREAAETCFDEQRTEMDTCRRTIESVLRERNGARQKLLAEVERREIWEATRDTVQGTHSMTILMTSLDEKRMRFERETEYDENWRDSVNDYLKECMQALYTLELEVDAKRRVFLDSESSFLMGHPRTVST